MTNKKIAIIGCGNLGLAILNGLLTNSSFKPSNITITKRKTSSLLYLKEQGVNITSNNKEAIEQSEILIIALKPYTILPILNEIKSSLDEKKHILISLATGITLEELENNTIPNLPIYRAMPNTAAHVGASMTCICSNSTNEVTTKLVTDCFNSVGSTTIINEDLMNAATVIGASGIAFVLRFIRAMTQGGIQIGFDAKTANEIVTNTVKGAAQLLIEGNQHPEYEIDKVTTPKGCTIEGLNEMEHKGFSSALIQGIISSYDKIER